LKTKFKGLSILQPRGYFVRSLSVLCCGGGLYFSVTRGILDREFAWLLLFISYLFIRGFTWFRWYEPNSPRAGVEDHFDKASVLGVLIIFCVGVFSFFTGWLWLIYLSLIPVGFLIFLNFVLISCHLRDSDPMAPNALSGDTRVF